MKIKGSCMHVMGSKIILSQDTAECCLSLPLFPAGESSISCLHGPQKKKLLLPRVYDLQPSHLTISNARVHFERTSGPNCNNPPLTAGVL